MSNLEDALERFIKSLAVVVEDLKDIEDDSIVVVWSETPLASRPIKDRYGFHPGYYGGHGGGSD